MCGLTFAVRDRGEESLSWSCPPFLLFHKVTVLRAIAKEMPCSAVLFACVGWYLGLVNTRFVFSFGTKVRDLLEKGLEEQLFSVQGMMNLQEGALKIFEKYHLFYPVPKNILITIYIFIDT